MRRVIPADQMALFIAEKQENWEIGRREIPLPGKGEVVVKIRATALNHFDWMVHKCGFFVDRYPAVVGVDGAGDVEDVGEGVTNLSIGDRVCHSGSFMTNNHATYQLYTLVPAKFVSKIPNTMSYDQAATIPFCLSAASFGLYSPLHLGGLGLTPAWRSEGRGKYHNLSIVVLGGASSVGKYVIQLARESGFSSIVATASITHHSLLRSLGATHVLDRYSRDLAQKIEHVLLKAAGGGGGGGKPHPSPSSPTPTTPTQNGITNGLSPPSPSPSTALYPYQITGLTDIVFDALSLPETRHLALQISNSRTGSVVFSLPPPDELLTRSKLGDRKVVTPCALPERQPEIAEGLFSALGGWLKAGVIKPNKHRTIPGGITAIPHGLKLLEARKFGGCKLIINP